MVYFAYDYYRIYTGTDPTMFAFTRELIQFGAVTWSMRKESLTQSKMQEHLFCPKGFRKLTFS